MFWGESKLHRCILRWFFLDANKKSDRSHLWIHEKTRPLCNEILISVARCWSENSVESHGRNPCGTMSWMLTKHLTQDTITVRTLDLQDGSLFFSLQKNTFLTLSIWWIFFDHSDTRALDVSRAGLEMSQMSLWSWTNYCGNPVFKIIV